MLTDEQIVALSSLERGLTIRRLQDELALERDIKEKTAGMLDATERDLEQAEKRAGRLLEIIDSINECHGCLDQRPGLREEVEHLRKEQR